MQLAVKEMKRFIGSMVQGFDLRLSKSVGSGTFGELADLAQLENLFQPVA